MKKPIIITAGLSFIVMGGCVMTPAIQKRQFIPIGSPIPAPAKQPSDVQLFANTSEVPYAYIPIGRITPEGNLEHHQSASDQISAIQALAATRGADGLIISKQILVKGGVVHSPEEGIVHRQETALYSGIAIVKTSTGNVVSPTPSQANTVSIGDLFAVPDQYLNKTIVVEGIYSRLTVGAQATGFLLTSTVNSQLELVCGYHNMALDETSRRFLMNQPSNASLRVEGHLIRSSDGAAKDAGLTSSSGFELAVTRILQ